MKKRYLFWDNYKGILILLVVFGHFLYSYAVKLDGSLVDDIFTFIYTFHMPAFIFCSGYLSKSEKARGKHAIIKLLLYYFVFNTLMMMYSYFFRGMSIKLLTPYNSYWYILSLIVWRLVIDELERIKGIIPISIAISLMLGYWSEFSNLLSIRRTIAFFAFFLLGYKLKAEKFEQLMERRNVKIYVLGVIFTIFAGFAVFYIVRYYDITLSMVLMGKYNYTRDILYRIFLLLASVLAIVALLLITPNCKIPVLSQIGKNSLLIYLVHRFITMIYEEIMPYTNYSPIYIIYALIATLITCIVLGNEKLNLIISNIFNTISESLLDRESKLGNISKLLILVLLLLLLSIKPIKEIVQYITVIF